MTFPRRKVASSLRRKGFKEQRDGHHVTYTYMRRDGDPTPVHTYMSHGSGSADIGATLISSMARQCRLSKNDFIRLVNCPMKREEYERKISDHL